MSKRTVFTTVTPLPAGISRETVIETLHSHIEIIDLNPLVEERHLIKPPPNASPEEYHCIWYSLTDRVSYLPGGMASGKVTYSACFHDLESGLQTHCYAPMGLNIKGKWSVGGSLPGEPVAPVELGLGVPLQGLYLREDVDMKCNIMMTSFVKKTLKKAHSALVGRLLVKAQIVDASLSNQRLSDTTLAQIPSNYSVSPASTEYAPSEYGESRKVDAPQIPPIQGLSFQGQNNHDFQVQLSRDPTLYPHALSVRSSVSSGSTPSLGLRASYQEANQNPRMSYQDSQPGLYNPRVSWQNLSTNRSPPLQSQQLSNLSQSPPLQQLDPAYHNSDPYRVSTHSYHAELPSDSVEFAKPETQYAASRVPGYQMHPPQHGHAELE